MKKLFEYVKAFFKIAFAGYILYLLLTPEPEELKKVRAEVKANLDWFESQGLLIKRFLAEPTGVYQPGYPNTYSFYGGDYFDYNFNEEKLNKLVELFKEDSWNELHITEENMHSGYPGILKGITENSIVLCKNNTGILFHMYDVEGEVVFVNGESPNTLISIVYNQFFPCYGLASE